MGIDAADRANLFKTFAKVFFQKRDLMATFMAKWSMDYPGQSGHYHFSVCDENDINVFADGAALDGMSEAQRFAVGGLQRYLSELLPMLAPTINSYTRLVKGAWAPTAATWGLENRTAAIRVIPGGSSSQRIECRVGGADANPYLVAAAVLSAGLAGIREKLEPESAIQGNAYEIEDSLPEHLRFATNLADAADKMHKSGLARRAFGDEFVEHFVMSRRWEVQEYQRNLNNWQLRRYFEII
jgi:glutamine synthetase